VTWLPGNKRVRLGSLGTKTLKGVASQGEKRKREVLGRRFGDVKGVEKNKKVDRELWESAEVEYGRSKAGISRKCDFGRVNWLKWEV